MRAPSFPVQDDHSDNSGATIVEGSGGRRQSKKEENGWEDPARCLEQPASMQKCNKNPLSRCDCTLL